MSMLQRIRPTKIELIRLRRFLALARKVHKILRERLTILVNEFMIRIREAYSLRKKFNDMYLDIVNKAIALYGFYGNNLFKYLEDTISERCKAIVGQENIMGIKTIAIMFKEGSFTRTPSFSDIDSFRAYSVEFLKLLISLGSCDRAIISIGNEIIRTRRKVNALEHILIPRLTNIIKYLRMKFEEREREEKARLKRVKAILERRGR